MFKCAIVRKDPIEYTLNKVERFIFVCMVTAHGVYVNTAHVVKTDIAATNGVVHLIDHVLVPSRYLHSLGK